MEKSQQLGLIAKFAREVGSNQKLGRKAFQKIVHLSTTLGNVPTGYSFSYYIYGPFSRELSSDLELAEIAGVILSSQDLSTGSYDIKPGELAPSAEKHASDYLGSYEAKLAKVLAAFGNKPAKSLELYSTIVFVEFAEPILLNDDAAMIKRINSLKPKYSDSEIASAIHFIRDFKNQAV